MNHSIIGHVVTCWAVASLLAGPTVAGAVPLVSHAPPDAFSSFIASNRVGLVERIRSSGYIREGQEWGSQGDLLAALGSGKQGEPPSAVLTFAGGLGSPQPA